MARLEPEKLVALQRAVVLRDMNHGLIAPDETCHFVATRNPELCNCRNAVNVDLLIRLVGEGLTPTPEEPRV